MFASRVDPLDLSAHVRRAPWLHGPLAVAVWGAMLMMGGHHAQALGHAHEAVDDLRAGQASWPGSGGRSVGDRGGDASRSVLVAQADSMGVTLPEIRERVRRDMPSSEEVGGYVVPQSRASTGLNLAPRGIPQSVTVMTRERIQDQGADTLSEVIRHTPGVTVKTTDSRGQNFQVRGFPVDNIQIDGVAMEWSGPWSTGESRDSTVIYAALKWYVAPRAF